MLVISPLNSLFKMICLALAFVTVPLAVRKNLCAIPASIWRCCCSARSDLLLLVGSEELLMIFIGLELLGLSLYVMAAFDKTDIAVGRSRSEIFSVRQHRQRVHPFRDQSGLRHVRHDFARARSVRNSRLGPIQPLLAVGIVMTLIGFAFKIAAAPFHLWAPDAYQGAPIPSAAFIASGSKVASFVVLGKIVLIGFAPAHGNAAWHAMHGRLVADPRCVGSVVDSVGKFRRSRANQRSPASRLLSRRARRLHFARTGRRRSRRIFGNAFLHDDLRNHSHRRVRRGRNGETRNRRRRFPKFRRAGIAFTAGCRLHGDFHAFARRVAAAGRIFRKVLSL